MEYKEALKRLPIEAKMYEYYVDHMGNVFSRHYKYRAFRQHKKERTESGYYRVSVAHKSVYVHKLAAIAFIPNPENKPFVNHIDNDKTNNHISNLEWCTNQENMQHYIKTTVLDYTDKRRAGKIYGADCKPKPINQLSLDGDTIRTFPSVNSTFKETGIEISGALSGRYKTAGGYRWEYAEIS